MNLEAGSVQLSTIGCVAADRRGMRVAYGQVCGLQGIGHGESELLDIGSAGKCAGDCDVMQTLKKCRKSASDAVNAVIACVTRCWREGGRGQGGFESGASKRAGAWRMAAFICMIPR